MIGLAPDARLHIREEADADSEVVGYVPGNARGLKSRICVANWCEITYNGLRGWVYKPFLVPDAELARAAPKPATEATTEADVINLLASSKRLMLAATEGGPIPVYAFPDDKLPVAGLLSTDTKEVQGLGSCMRSWCYIRAGRLIGWVHISRFDVKATTSADATSATAEAAPAPEVTAAVETAPAEPAPAAKAAAAPAEEKALNKTETTASNVAIGGKVAALPKLIAGEEGKFYALAGLGDSALPIYDKPDANAPILAWIPKEAKNIEGLKKCQDRWCLVRWEATTGWVVRRHLADEASGGGQSFQVTGLPLWSPLKVLDHPDDNANEVGSIPSYATGIVPIGSCNQYWCHIRYLGIAGWVAARHLQPQAP